MDDLWLPSLIAVLELHNVPLTPRGSVVNAPGVYKKMVAAKDFKLTYDMLRENNIIGGLWKWGIPKTMGFKTKLHPEF